MHTLETCVIISKVFSCGHCITTDVVTFGVHTRADAVLRLLHLNAAQSTLKQGGDDDLYKVLVLDSYTKSVIAPLLRVNDLRKHGITMHLMLENEREKIPDTPAVYFVQAKEEAVRRIVADASEGLYDSLHLNFTPHLPKPLLEQLATGVCARLACVA